MDEPQKPEWVKFGQRVNRLRKQQGLSLARLATATGWSATYLGKIENAKRSPNADVVEDLDRALRTNGALLRDWGDILRARTTPEWYEQSRDYEKRAREIRFFHQLVVPGFFQTPEYSRALVSHTVPGASEERIQNILRTRKSWRDGLRTDEGLTLNVILTEAALRQAIPPDIMRAQIDRLLHETEAPTITVQVLPVEISDLTWLVGPFRLIYIEGEHPLLCTEHPVGEYLTADGYKARQMEAVFSKLQAWALDPDTSVRKLKEMRQEH